MENRVTNLDQAWENARKVFLQRTKLDLASCQSKTLDQVLLELDEHYNPDPSKLPEIEKKRRIRENVVKVLNVVEILGGIAAQGVSVVFGSAGICFSAVSLVLTAPAKVFQIDEGIAELFEEVSHFLVRFEILKRIDAEGLLDKILINNSANLLIQLVDICGLVIAHLQRNTWGRLKISLKAVLADDDSGVQDALRTFGKLADRQRSIIQDFSLLHAARTDASTERMEPKLVSLWLETNERKMKQSTQELLQDIADKLSIPTTHLDDIIWKSREGLLSMAKHLLPSSQTWLQSLVPYSEWRHSAPGIRRLLYASGGAKGGKSCFLATVYQSFVSVPGDVIVGHHCFVRETLQRSEVGGVKMEQAAFGLKSMALQFARLNSKYAALLHKSLKDAPLKDDCKLQDLWKVLFPLPADALSNLKLVMLFDDLDHMRSEVAEAFLSLLYEQFDATPGQKGVKLWIAMTGSNHLLRRLAHPMDQLHLSSASDSLIKEYIQKILETNPIFSGTHKGMAQLKMDLQTHLPRLANGNFSFIDKRIARVALGVETGEYSLERLLQMVREEATVEIGEEASRTISELERKLSASDVAQLNDLLAWTIYAGGSLTSKQLEAALFLSSDQEFLLPLEAKLRHKFGGIFELGQDIVTVREDIADFLRASSRGSGHSDANDMKISLNITIERADVLTVKNFLWQLHESISSGDLKFDFGQPAEQIRGQRIQIDATEAYFTMATQCLKLLTDERHDQGISLVPFAWKRLPFLLKELKIMSQDRALGPSQKRIILQRLIGFLGDGEGWRRFWNDRHTALHPVWLEPPEVLETIQYWLTDEESLKAVEPGARRWAKDAMDPSKPPGECWKYVTEEMARQWLRNRHLHSASCFNWIHCYLSMRNKVTPLSKGGGMDRSLWLSNIEAAAVWARECLNLTEVDALYFERLGATCYFGFVEGGPEQDKAVIFNAIKSYCGRAQELPMCSWRVFFTLAKAHASMKHFETAISLMEQALERLNGPDNPEQMSAGKMKAAQLEILKLLGGWKTSCGFHEDASKRYKEVLVLNPRDYDCQWRRFRSLCISNREVEARDLLSQLDREPGEHAGRSQLFESIRLFRAFNPRSRFVEDILRYLATQTRDEAFLTKILTVFQDNILAAQHDKQMNHQACLLLCQGIILAASTNDAYKLQLAHQSWRKCISISSGGPDVWRVAQIALRHEANYHFDQLLEDNQSESKARIHVYHLENAVEIAGKTGGQRFKSPATYLAAFFRLRGELDRARKVLVTEMRRALEILSDDDPDNDFLGYQMLAYVLNCIGDPLDALSAWSLLGPTVVTKESSTEGDAKMEPKGNLSRICDGRCGRSWTYANDIWACAFCPDTDFCTGCRELLLKGGLKRYICSAKHDWLHVPKWTEIEEDGVTEGRVRVGGKLEDGRRVGGEVVEIQTWLDRLRTEWKSCMSIEDEEINRSGREDWA